MRRRRCCPMASRKKPGGCHAAGSRAASSFRHPEIDGQPVSGDNADDEDEDHPVHPVRGVGERLLTLKTAQLVEVSDGLHAFTLIMVSMSARRRNGSVGYPLGYSLRSVLLSRRWRATILRTLRFSDRTRSMYGSAASAGTPALIRRCVLSSRSFGGVPYRSDGDKPSAAQWAAFVRLISANRFMFSVPPSGEESDISSRRLGDRRSSNPCGVALCVCDQFARF